MITHNAFYLLVPVGVACLAAAWWIMARRRRWRPRATPAPDFRPEPAFAIEPAVHSFDTPRGAVLVTHAAMHDCCVTGYSLHSACAMTATAAARANAWRIVLDIPPQATFFRRFFWFLRAVACDAAKHGGLLIVRYAPESAEWFKADDSPFYRAIPIGDLQTDLRYAAEQEPWATPELDEL